MMSTFDGKFETIGYFDSSACGDCLVRSRCAAGKFVGTARELLDRESDESVEAAKVYVEQVAFLDEYDEDSTDTVGAAFTHTVKELRAMRHTLPQNINDVVLGAIKVRQNSNTSRRHADLERQTQLDNLLLQHEAFIDQVDCTITGSELGEIGDSVYKYVDRDVCRAVYADPTPPPSVSVR